LKHEPGTFLTFSKNSGRVAFWNVSKKNYNEIAKFSDGPIMNCIALGDPNNILFTLENGSVVIFDVKNRKRVFILEPNHSETIFDLKYNQLSYGIFATCSYESAIKIWDLNENKIIWDIDVDYMLNKSSLKKEEKNCTHVYSLKWSPNDKELLLSGDSKGFIRIWNISTKKLVVSYKLSNSPDAQTIGIDWNKQDNIICTCGDLINLLTYDKFSFKLNISKSFKVNTSVFQIKFDPFLATRYAVACMDGKIRIFNTNEYAKDIKNLIGHKGKVFGIAFHPNVKNLLASTSDDCSIGIWNLPQIETDSKNQNSNYKSFFLHGHEKNTRHIIWLKDRSNILISGSWDGTIKIWNTDMRALISNISEHYSDVYGLDISPHHPYLLTSCSRDNSIRFFNILSVSLSASDIILSFDELDFSKCRNYFSKLEEKLKEVEKNLDIVSAADIISRYFFVNIF
jgi:WD40 repeat protein